MAPLLLLEDLVEGVSPPADGRLALVSGVLVRGDRAGGGGRDAEGAGGARGGEDGGGGGGAGDEAAAPQLPEAGALLQAAEPGALKLRGVEPGREEEGLGAVRAS